MEMLKYVCQNKSVIKFLVINFGSENYLSCSEKFVANAASIVAQLYMWRVQCILQEQCASMIQLLLATTFVKN